MSRHRWFLPETPDVVGLLREQVEITISALDALRSTRDLTTESQVMECPPDEVVAEMARLLAESMRAIDRNRAAARADVLRRDGGPARDHHGRAERIARRELYRRCARIGELVIDVADRVVDAVVKQS